MWRGFILGVTFTLLLTFAAAYFGVTSGVIPAAADQPAGPVEAWVAAHDLAAVIHRQAPATPNPVALTDANLIKGVGLYADHCVACHGTSGGDTAQGAVAKGEAPRPPQLATDGVEDDP